MRMNLPFSLLQFAVHDFGAVAVILNAPAQFLVCILDQIQRSKKDKRGYFGSDTEKTPTERAPGS